MSDPGARGPTPEVFAGVDIGGTTTQVLLCTADLTVIDSTEVSTPAREGGQAMVRAALDALSVLRARVPSRLLGIGIGAAGVVDSRAGRILVASDSFRSWAGFEVTATVQEALGVPAFLDNDVNAFLRGEAAKGAVVDEPYVLGMTLGTGVGGALRLNGQLLDGPHGAAGEVGHIPGFGDLPAPAVAAGTWRHSPPAARSGRGTANGRDGFSPRGVSRRRQPTVTPTRSPCTRPRARESRAPS